ncbi:hypothetical protein DSL72_006460 [Monilinia vaccinii-corymbosi]|uniref:Very long-chain fatty acid transport protein n=1 Tax=Monilinia vaccinii-corymbosi TaxID=61207 RepID=A0A8A3PN56_9HELO|nr:hypothetical protein DSL72_006460 [Monilinia vaccinii-corymbosi]
MALATAVAAGTSAAAMYLDGKYSIVHDLQGKLKMRRARKRYDEAEKNRRLCLYYLFEDRVKAHPNAECLWSREGCYTWAESYDRVHQYGQWYLTQGVKPGDLVAFYLQNSPNLLLAWLGLWSIGAAPAMINHNLAGNALLHCIKVPKVNLILVDDDLELRSRIEAEQATLEGELGIKITVMDSSTLSEIHNLKAERPEDFYREGVNGKSPMGLLYTSGTTGLPKGCICEVGRFYLTSASRVVGKSLIKDDDRWYNCMPLYHGTGGLTAILNLTNGVTNCIGKKFSTSKFWGDIRDSRATWFTYVGETARYLLAAPPSPQDKDHCVRVMYGNGMRPDVWKKFTERFGVPEVIEFFNSTEGLLALSNHSRGDYLAHCVGHHGLISRWQFHDVYVPVRVDEVSGDIARDPKTGFAIREPYEKGGEIIVAIPDTSAFSGYFDNPEVTSKKYARDVFKKGDLYYRSGDSLRRDNEGRWYFLDRLGDTFRWKGENVSTAEVAEVLGKYEGVMEAIVYGVQLPSHDGRAGCAAVFIDPNIQNFDFAGLLRHTRKHLPKYAVPIFLRIVKEMTPIHNNKQNKAPLREQGIEHDKVKSDDKLLWIEEKGKGNTYVEFHRDHWTDLEYCDIRNEGHIGTGVAKGYCPNHNLENFGEIQGHTERLPSARPSVDQPGSQQPSLEGQQYQPYAQQPHGTLQDGPHVTVPALSNFSRQSTSAGTSKLRASAPEFVARPRTFRSAFPEQTSLQSQHQLPHAQHHHQNWPPQPSNLMNSNSNPNPNPGEFSVSGSQYPSYNQNQPSSFYPASFQPGSLYPSLSQPSFFQVRLFPPTSLLLSSLSQPSLFPPFSLQGPSSSFPPTSMQPQSSSLQPPQQQQYPASGFQPPPQQQYPAQNLHSGYRGGLTSNVPPSRGYSGRQNAGETRLPSSNLRRSLTEDGRARREWIRRTDEWVEEQRSSRSSNDRVRGQNRHHHHGRRK